MFLAFFFYLFYSSTVDVLCCVNFCCIAKWFSYMHIYIFFQILFSYRLLQNIEQNSLCCIVGHSWFSTLYVVAWRRQWHPTPVLLPRKSHGRRSLGGSKITADGDCSHEIKRRLLLGRKVTTNLDSIFKSWDITLPTKVHLVKPMVFPVVMYGCES